MNSLNRRRKKGNRIRKTFAAAGITAALIFNTIPIGLTTDGWGPKRTFAEQTAWHLKASVTDEEQHYHLLMSLEGEVQDGEGGQDGAVVFYAPGLSEKWSPTGPVKLVIQPAAIPLGQLPVLKTEIDPLLSQAQDFTEQLKLKLAEDIQLEVNPETGETATFKVSDVIDVNGLPHIEEAVKQLADQTEALASLPAYTADVPVDADARGAVIADFSEGFNRHLESVIEERVSSSAVEVGAGMEGLELSVVEQQEVSAAKLPEVELLLGEIMAEIIEPGKARMTALIEKTQASMNGEQSPWTAGLDSIEKTASVKAETAMRVAKPVGTQWPVVIQAGLTNPEPGQGDLIALKASTEVDFNEKNEPVKIPDGPVPFWMFAGEWFAAGEGLVGATVFAKSGGNHIGHAVVQAPETYFAEEIIVQNNGYFEMELERPLVEGEIIEFYQETEDGQRSESVYVEVLPATDDEEFEPTLELPQVDDIYDIDSFITGTADPGNMVVAVTEEDLIGLAEVMEDGTFLMELETSLEAGTEVGFIQVSESEEYSDFVFKTVLEAEMSLEPPTVDPIDDDDLSITGSAGGGHVVIAAIDDELIGAAEADDEGRYTIDLTESLKAGTVVELLQLSGDGQYSDTISVTVLKAGDMIVEKPMVQPITDKDRTVAGKGLPGHTVMGYLDNEEFGSADVGEDGQFSMQLDHPFPAGTVLEFRQSDQDGKLSEPVQITVEKAAIGTGSDNKGDNGVDSGTKGTTASGSGQKLPKTATATGAIGLAGGGALLAGLLIRRFARMRGNAQ